MLSLVLTRDSNKTGRSVIDQAHGWVRALWYTSHPDLTRTQTFFLLQHSISYSRIFKLEFYFMKKCSCRESNSKLLIESTLSYPLDQQDNDAGKCNFLVIIF